MLANDELPIFDLGRGKHVSEHCVRQIYVCNKSGKQTELSTETSLSRSNHHPSVQLFLTDVVLQGK